MCSSIVPSQQCVLAQFHFAELGMFFAHPEDDQLFGVTVKDPDTCGYLFFLYRCSVKNHECTVSFCIVSEARFFIVSILMLISKNRQTLRSSQFMTMHRKHKYISSAYFYNALCWYIHLSTT